MNLLEEVRPGANRYISGSGILKGLPAYLSGFHNGAIITGTKSYEVFQAYYGDSLPYDVFQYDGSASDEDGRRLAESIGSVDVIIGIGGGRVLDTAKLTAEILKCRLILIPTLISNCAPYAPVAAVYELDHAFKRVGAFTLASFITFVDWDFLLATPKEYFVAGIGDTIAKWYEIEGITRQLPESAKTASVRLGIATAKEILEILKNDSTEALANLEQQVVTPAFGRIADTIIALAGAVGGFAHKYGRVAGAHSIHNGLSLLPETNSVLHGYKVAYGILVQLSYTGELDEVAELLPLYKKIGLPFTLTALNLPAFNEEVLLPVAEFAAKKEESFVMIDAKVTAKKLLSSIERLETFTANQ